MRRFVLLLATAALLGAAGCSASSERGSPTSKGAADTAGAPGNQTAALPVRAAAEVRSIVYKGELTVRASNVDDAAAEAGKIATDADGVVAGDNRHNEGDDANADLVLRIPSAKFYDTVGTLADELGTELSRNISTEDVTEASVDLDARIASQKASVDRTRALLARGEQISDIVTVEQELARREGELASLQARQRSLADKVTLSTITLHLIGPKAAAPEEENDTFFTGLAAGWGAFIATANFALVVFGAMLPFLIALAIPVALTVWLLRRRRPRPIAPPPPATEG